MNISDLLSIDKFFCVTTFNNQERLLNIINLKKTLDVEIEIIPAEIDENPRMSFNRTMIGIIKRSKGKFNRILIFEDDADTDLSNFEICQKISNSKIDGIEFDILSLGSICYQKTTLNESLYLSDVFGYTHAVVYNLYNISDDFIKSLEHKCLVEKMFFDSALSTNAENFNKSIVFRESIFIQKNFNSISGGVADIYNLGWRYKINQDILSNFRISSQEIMISKSNTSYLTKHFKIDEIRYVRLDFEKISDSELFNLKTVITDVDSGIIFNSQQAYNSNFWSVFEVPVDRFMVEIYDSNHKCYFRQILNVSHSNSPSN